MSFVRILLASALVVFMLLTFAENYMIFPGSWQREKPARPDFPSIGLEFWERQTKEGIVEAAFIPAKGESQGTVLFSHGNNELIDDWFFALSPYYEKLGFNLLLVEFRGYGRSKGKPREKGLVDDLVFFHEMLVEKKGKPLKTVLHGRSLGGGVISSAAGLIKPTHMVFQSTFSSLVKRAFEMMYVPSFLIANKFESTKHLKKLEIPGLVIHGKQDTLIPVQHGQELYDNLRGKKDILLVDGDHNSPIYETEEFWTKISGFLQGE